MTCTYSEGTETDWVEYWRDTLMLIDHPEWLDDQAPIGGEAPAVLVRKTAEAVVAEEMGVDELSERVREVLTSDERTARRLGHQMIERLSGSAEPE